MTLTRSASEGDVAVFPALALRVSALVARTRETPKLFLSHSVGQRPNSDAFAQRPKGANEARPTRPQPSSWQAPSWPPASASEPQPAPVRRAGFAFPDS